jgi:lipopolysaccharide export system ATP-binding protein
MDEPFSGVDPLSVQDVQSIICGLNKQGMGILITRHNVRETLRVVDRAYLLDEGRILCSRSSEALVNDPQSHKLYLGEDFQV